MAATRLIALHINKGKTVAQCLADRTDYTENAAKTEDVNTLVRMPVMKRPVMKNFCFPNDSMSISREEPRLMM